MRIRGLKKNSGKEDRVKRERERGRERKQTFAAYDEELRRGLYGSKGAYIKRLDERIASSRSNEGRRGGVRGMEGGNARRGESRGGFKRGPGEGRKAATYYVLCNTEEERVPGRRARGILRNVGCDITAKYSYSPPLSLSLSPTSTHHTTPYAWDTQYASKRAAGVKVR